MEGEGEGPGVHPGEGGHTGPGVVAEVHPGQPGHGDLLEHAAVQAAGQPVVAQVEPLQPLEGAEHRPDGAEPVMRDIQVPQPREGCQTRVQAGQLVVRNVEAAEVLEFPDDGVMMVSALTRVTAQEVGQAAVGHCHRGYRVKTGKVMEVQTSQMTLTDLQTGDGPRLKGPQGRRGVEAGAPQLAITDTHTKLTQRSLGHAAF